MGTQGLEEAKLGVPCSKDDIGLAARLDGLPHDICSLLRSGPAHVVIRWINTNKQQIVFGFEDRFQFCHPVKSYCNSFSASRSWSQRKADVCISRSICADRDTTRRDSVFKVGVERVLSQFEPKTYK